MLGSNTKSTRSEPMHHKRGRDYQAANVGWLWKQQHVYTGGENDSNFTGTRQINKYGDSQGVGVVTDRYRFTWVVMRYNIPASRWLIWRRRATASRNGTDTALGTASLSITAHTSLALTTSSRTNGFGWPVTITNQSSQVSDTFSLDFPTATTLGAATTAMEMLIAGTEVAMVKL